MRIDDEQLMRELGKLAREEGTGAEEDRWEACCRGEETVGEALRGEASAEDAGLAEELFRPLDPGFKAELAGKARAEAEAAPPPTGSVAGGTATRRGRDARRLALAAMAVPLAVALAIAVYLLPAGGEDFDYQVTVAGHARTRAGDEAAETWRPDVPLVVELEAVDQIEGPLEVAVIAHRGPACLSLDREQRVRSRGSIDLRVYGEGLVDRIAPGGWTLIFVVARPGGLPAADAVCRGAQSSRWKAFRKPVEVQEAPP